MNHLRVTFFQYEKLTGYDTYIFDFSRVLTKNGHFVTIVTSNQMPLIGGARALSKKDILDRLGNSKWIEMHFLKFFPSLSSFRLLGKIMANSDVVYVKNEVLDLLPVLIANRYTRTPIICGVHTSLYYYDWKSFRAIIHNNVYNSILYRHLLSSCDMIHVLNLDDYSFLKKILHVNPSKLHVMPLWINHEEFKPYIKESPNSSFRILYLGGLDMRKGIDVLLRSFDKLFKEFPDKFNRMSFTIVGKGPLVDYVKAAQTKYDNINYQPFIIGSPVDLYNQHDMVVVPSRGETFSYVTLEALSCGLPVIASDIPGPRSIIKNENIGKLFHVGDASSLTKAILSMYDIWNNKSLYKNLRWRCRQYVLNDFTQNKIINKFENILKNATVLKPSGIYQ